MTLLGVKFLPDICIETTNKGIFWDCKISWHSFILGPWWGWYLFFWQLVDTFLVKRFGCADPKITVYVFTHLFLLEIVPGRILRHPHHISKEHKRSHDLCQQFSEVENIVPCLLQVLNVFALEQKTWVEPLWYIEIPPSCTNYNMVNYINLGTFQSIRIFDVGKFLKYCHFEVCHAILHPNLSWCPYQTKHLMTRYPDTQGNGQDERYDHLLPGFVWIGKHVCFYVRTLSICM